jgi:hypothetical protein
MDPALEMEGMIQDIMDSVNARQRSAAQGRDRLAFSHYTRSRAGSTWMEVGRVQLRAAKSTCACDAEGGSGRYRK